MKELGKKVEEPDINDRLDQTMIGLDAEAFAWVLRWLDEPLTEAEAEGYRRLARARGKWADDPKS